MSSRYSNFVLKPQPSKADSKGKTKSPSKPLTPPITKNGSGLSMNHESIKAYLPMSPSASTSKNQTNKFPQGTIHKINLLRKYTNTSSLSPFCNLGSE